MVWCFYLSLGRCWHSLHHLQAVLELQLRITAQNHSSERRKELRSTTQPFPSQWSRVVLIEVEIIPVYVCMCRYMSVYVYSTIPCILTSYLKLLLTVNLFAFSPGTSSRFHSTMSIRCLDLISLFGTGVQETCLPPDVHVKCTPNLTAWLTSQVCLVSLLLAACYM